MSSNGRELYVLWIQRSKILQVLKIHSLFILQTHTCSPTFYIPYTLRVFWLLTCARIWIVVAPRFSNISLSTPKVGFFTLSFFYLKLYSNTIALSCWCVVDLFGRIRIVVYLFLFDCLNRLKCWFWKIVSYNGWKSRVVHDCY